MQSVKQNLDNAEYMHEDNICASLLPTKSRQEVKCGVGWVHVLYGIIF